MEKRGIKVVVVLNPAPPSIYREIQANTSRFSYIQEARKELKLKIPHYYDYLGMSDFIPIKDSDFRDDRHGYPIVQVKILKDMSQKEPWLKAMLNHQQI